MLVGRSCKHATDDGGSTTSSGTPVLWKIGQVSAVTDAAARRAAACASRCTQGQVDAQCDKLADVVGRTST